jgi:basic membrane lipoprotein Med (substrate-binding protein (PBP1-ABC) superfamily)
MIMSGGDSQSTSNFANAFPATYFIDIDQPVPCLTPEQQFDPEGECLGGIAAIPGNQLSVGFDADQPAYLAGVIAASASRNDRLGIISATPRCSSCNRIIQGFARGARSIEPEIDIDIAYLADEASFDAEGGEAAAFGDVAAARTFARAFIDVYEPDVVLPVAGNASRGIVEAVCEKEGVLAVGTDHDVAAAYPDLGACVLASIVKDYEYAVREAVFAWARGDLSPVWRLGLDDDRTFVSDEWTRRPGLPVELPGRYADAAEGILTGRIGTCAADCELPFDPGAPTGPVQPAQPTGPEDEQAAEPEPVDHAEPAASPGPL